VRDEELGRAIAEVDAVLLLGHGVITVGPDAETALLRMELVEHLAKIALVARQLGGPLPLPREDVEAALAARAKAGLGPKPSESPSYGSSATTAARPDVSALVRDALQRIR
jgi:ribulose-5-phosphate 4-epimerase/fuculose-1-phosphate aldolase